MSAVTLELRQGNAAAGNLAIFQHFRAAPSRPKEGRVHRGSVCSGGGAAIGAPLPPVREEGLYAAFHVELDAEQVAGQGSGLALFLGKALPGRGDVQLV